MKTDLPAVFIAFKRKETPLLAKITAAVTIVYALSPIDLIPDFIPIAGLLDDIIILPALIALTVRLIPKEVMDGCKTEAEGMLQNGKPKKWYYAVPIAVFWLAVLYLIVRAIV